MEGKKKRRSFRGLFLE